MKRILQCIAALSIIATVICTIMLFVPNHINEDQVIIITPRTPLKVIANDLYDQKLVKCQNLFMIYTLLTQNKGELLSGEYNLPARSSIVTIVGLLRRGSNISHRITTPEGMRTIDIIEMINTHPNLQGEKIQVTFDEATLAPNTYYFQYGDSRQQIINNMLSRMAEIRARIALALPEFTIAHPYIKSVDDVIILASIVEKEARFDEERPLIAAVFLNRLKKKMRLQADPTVVYAIENDTDRHNTILSKADLKFDSPYNTYTNHGLPPAPIASPGEKSILAVLNPAKVEYLYFVADNTGRHNFASDLAKHNEHVKLYRSKETK